MNEQVEFSTCRDPDSHPWIDINVGKNLLSISISPRGDLSWAYLVPEVKSLHGVVKESELGKVLYSLLNEALEVE